MADDVAVMRPDQYYSLLIVTLAIATVIAFLMFLFGSFRKAPEDEENDEEEKDSKTKAKTISKKQQKAQAARHVKQNNKKVFTHPLLVGSLKEHSDNILDFDFSINGKYLASCSEDRTVRVWSVKDFKEKQHKTIRGNVEYDHATNVKFSPDCKAFVVSLSNGNCIRVFKMGKKEDGSPGVIPAADFPKKHNEDVLAIGIGSPSNGSYIMTAYRDTIIHIWDTKGDLLDTIDTHQMNHNHAAVSPCGRFVASCGFTPDVKIIEIVFSKTGEYQEARKAMDLKGHKASVYYFSFNLDSTRVATVSKDNTWKLWNTNVEFHKNQDPYLLFTGSHDFSGPCLIAVTTDAHTVAIAAATRLCVYNTKNGEQEEEFEEVHTAEITKVAFDYSGKFLVTSGDKHLRVFHNIVGLKATIGDMDEKLKKATTKATKERLEFQLKEARQNLENILEKINEEQ